MPSSGRRSTSCVVERIPRRLPDSRTTLRGVTRGLRTTAGSNEALVTEHFDHSTNGVDRQGVTFGPSRRHSYGARPTSREFFDVDVAERILRDGTPVSYPAMRGEVLRLPRRRSSRQRGGGWAPYGEASPVLSVQGRSWTRSPPNPWSPTKAYPSQERIEIGIPTVSHPTQFLDLLVFRTSSWGVRVRRVGRQAARLAHADLDDAALESQLLAPSSEAPVAVAGQLGLRSRPS